MPLAGLTLTQTALSAVVAYIAWVLLRPFIVKSPFHNLPGPSSGGWLVGAAPQLFGRLPWKFREDLMRQYGRVVAVPGMFGKKWLIVNDPKAFHNIFLKEQDIYFEENSMLGTLLGPGLLGTSGDQHKRQRKMLNPVFSTKHLREMMPVFRQVITKTRVAISGRVHATSSGTAELDMLSWMGRTTLEVLGQAGLGYSFDPLTEDRPDEFANAVKDLFPQLEKVGVVGFLLRYFKHIGTPAFQRMALKIFPNRNIHRLQEVTDVLHERSVLIFNEKKAALEKGDEGLKTQIGEGHDIMSVLLRENMLASEEDKLPDDELIAQVSTMILAGMDTTANSLARLLEILADEPDRQEKLRTEIMDAVETDGDDGFVDFDRLMALPYLEAVCRETLRLHPGVALMLRQTSAETVMPLSEPIRLRDGTMAQTIPIPKDSFILANLMACNRDKALWGPDADEFRPERWLEPLPREVEEARIPGVYSHLMTFIGGSKACIGFKFAQVELKAVIFVLLQHFKFEPTGKKIFWNSAAVQYPSVELGEPELPLKVSLLRT